MISQRNYSPWRAQHKFLAACIGVAILSFQNPALAQNTDNLPLIAQTSTLGPITAIGAQTTRKKKRSIITDSLWGNLILECAYDQDPVLHKVGAEMKLMNLATSFGIAAIAGGTLFQGIYALAAINPPDPHQDSYVPGITGITLSSCTLFTLLARQILGRELGGHVRKRQYALKGKVETLLARLEDTHCDDTTATGQLKELIGDQAAGEWLQMWRSTHRLSTEARRIGMDTPATGVKLMATAGTSEGGM